MLKEVVREDGFELEAHHLTTKDKYGLTLHRIVPKNVRTHNAISFNEIVQMYSKEGLRHFCLIIIHDIF